MNEVDENGWAHIHQAAKKGYFKSVEKFIKASEDQLEFETQDALGETPLLISVRAGPSNTDTISVILECGGNVTAVNNLNHGLIEICCMEGHTDLLKFFIEMNHGDLPVWSKILKFFCSENEEESFSAGRCLCELTHPKDDATNPNWKHVYDNDGVNKLVEILKSDIGNSTKCEAIQCLINIMGPTEVKEQIIKFAGLEMSISHLKSKDRRVLELDAIVIGKLCTIGKYADQATNKGVMAALVNVLETDPAPQVIVEIVKTLGILCEGSQPRQSMFGKTAGIIDMCTILSETRNADVMLALCHSISKICRHHEGNQIGFVDNGVAMDIIVLSDIKKNNIQLAAVETIHMLVENNRHTQAIFSQEGAIGPLITLLNRSKNPIIQEKTAGALWALAGDDEEEKKTMAATMGVVLLIDFLSSLSETLHFIGSECLGVLAQGASNKQDEIAAANGVQPLVRLLKCDKEYLVLSSIRSLRHMCVTIGYLPHSVNQATVAKTRGLKLLIALMTLSKNELIQVESALTLACACLGHSANISEVMSMSSHLEFSYVRILKLLYAEKDAVRILAGAALAAFAYNNMAQQHVIAMEGGVRFGCFERFLHRDDEYLRCNAAFQIVVLARIIPDEEQAVSSAVGIKLIVDILNDSKTHVIQALACDCVARLAHTRAGIPSALIAINTVNRLCDLTASNSSRVRGCASVALSYLSYNHTAERQLLNRCRHDSYIMKCLQHYISKHKISPKFLHEWKHYKTVGSLPAISNGRPNLISQSGYRVDPHSKSVDKSLASHRSVSKDNLPRLSVSPRQESSLGLEPPRSRASRVSFQTESEILSTAPSQSVAA